MKKTCTKCNIEKDFFDFEPAEGCLYGVRGDCKDCRANQRKTRYKKNKEKYLKRQNNYWANLTKEQKEKIRKQRHEQYEENKEEISKKAKVKRDKPENKIKNAKYQKFYRKNSENRLRRNKQQNEQYSTDIDFKIKTNLRGRINKALKRNSKSKKTIELLGCTIEKLKQHLEKQFQLGMTWNNHNAYGWHIDHVKPCAKFDLSKPIEQRKCFNFKNLQPLWAEDNLKKGSEYVVLKKS